MSASIIACQSKKTEKKGGDARTAGLNVALVRACPKEGISKSVVGSPKVQGLAKEWSLGCVKCAPRPEEARTRESRNLRDHF